MTLGDLCVLYGVAGVASAGFVLKTAPSRDRSALWSAALTLPLWPLWLPIALSARRSAPPRGSAESCATRRALWEAHQAVLGSPLEPLLPKAAALRMMEEVERAGQRYAELVSLLEDPSFDARAAEQRIAELERVGTSARGLAPARLHLENVRRIQGLRERDERTLQELGELTTTLRTQLVLARYAGSAPDNAGDIVSEVWARVEVLGSTLEAP